MARGQINGGAAAFAEWFRRGRTISKLKQDEIADALDIHQTLVSKWQNGWRVPGTRAQAIELARLLSRGMRGADALAFMNEGLALLEYAPIQDHVEEADPEWRSLIDYYSQDPQRKWRAKELLKTYHRIEGPAAPESEPAPEAEPRRPYVDDIRPDLIRVDAGEGIGAWVHSSKGTLSPEVEAKIKEMILEDAAQRRAAADAVATSDKNSSGAAGLDVE